MQGVLFQEEVKQARGVSVTQLILGPGRWAHLLGAQATELSVASCCASQCGERWVQVCPATQDLSPFWQGLFWRFLAPCLALSLVVLAAAPGSHKCPEVHRAALIPTGTQPPAGLFLGLRPKRTGLS